MKKLNHFIQIHFLFLWLILTAVVVSVYFAYTLPVSFDEACTYILFTSQGLLETISNYPAPNNHVFYSILSIISNNLPFGSILIKMRLLSISINIVSLLALYKFALTFYSRNFGLLLIAIYSGLFLTIYYSYMARGYGLVTLFFIVCLYYAFKIISDDERWKNFLFIGFFSVLGLYTIPTYIYPLISIIVYIHLIKPNLFLTLFKTILGIALAVMLLYFPIIYKCGLNSIIDNPFVQPMELITTLKSIPVYVLFTIHEITGIHWAFVMITFGISLYFILKSKDKTMIYFALAMFLIPLVIIIIQRLNPYARVFNYCSIVFLILLLIPYKNLIKKIQLRLLIPYILIIQIVLFFNFKTKILAYEDKDWALNITSNEIIKKIQGNHNYYINGNLLAYNLKFGLMSNGFRNYTIEEEKGKAISADTLKKYDYIIIGLDFDKTKNKKPLFITKYYNVYSEN